MAQIVIFGDRQLAKPNSLLAIPTELVLSRSLHCIYLTTPWAWGQDFSSPCPAFWSFPFCQKISAGFFQDFFLKNSFFTGQVLFSKI